MRTIWKYKFDDNYCHEFEIPKGGIILKVDRQTNGVGHITTCMWVDVTDDAVLEKRIFYIIGTGQPLNCTKDTYLVYIDTFQQGPYVGHIYEIKSLP